MSQPIVYSAVAVAIGVALVALSLVVRWRPACMVGQPAAASDPGPRKPIYITTNAAQPPLGDLEQLAEVERSAMPWLLEQLTSEAGQVADINLGNDPPVANGGAGQSSRR